MLLWPKLYFQNCQYHYLALKETNDFQAALGCSSLTASSFLDMSVQFLLWLKHHLAPWADMISCLCGQKSHNQIFHRVFNRRLLLLSAIASTSHFDLSFKLFEFSYDLRNDNLIIFVWKMVCNLVTTPTNLRSNDRIECKKQLFLIFKTSILFISSLRKYIYTPIIMSKLYIF